MFFTLGLLAFPITLCSAFAIQQRAVDFGSPAANNGLMMDDSGEPMNVSLSLTACFQIFFILLNENTGHHLGFELASRSHRRWVSQLGQLNWFVRIVLINKNGMVVDGNFFSSTDCLGS